MSFCERWILPRLLDLGMRNKEARRHRERMAELAATKLRRIKAALFAAGLYPFTSPA